MNIIETLDKKQAAAIALTRAKILPEFAPGDTVRRQRQGDAEGTRSRVQAYEGVCIARSGGGLNENFTVRKISYGEGVERVFPIYSPVIDLMKWSAGARCAGRSSITSAAAAASRPASPRARITAARRRTLRGKPRRSDPAIRAYVAKAGLSGLLLAWASGAACAVLLPRPRLAISRPCPRFATLTGSFSTTTSACRRAFSAG